MPKFSVGQKVYAVYKDGELSLGEIKQINGSFDSTIYDIHFPYVTDDLRVPFFESAIIPARVILPETVQMTGDKFARYAGLFWEARFNHPKMGSVVLPAKSKMEAMSFHLYAPQE